MKHYPVETFEVSTLLNGAVIELVMGIDRDWDEDGETVSSGLWAVMYDGVDILPILDQQTLNALEAEGHAAMSDWSFEQSNI